jgi:prolyl oligopeptidase
MLQKKQNVFDDFIAAAEYLLRSGVTSKEKLAIFGTSNGGLLVGAAMTQRPDLFHAVVCGAPLLDMVRYQSFKIAKLWVPEYGSSDDPKQFPYILKYSPYQHVERGVEYPAVLFWTGDNDTRVDPLHARKMAALMQAEAARERPILIRYDTLTGHSGGRSVDQQLDFDTDLLAFVRSQIG